MDRLNQLRDKAGGASDSTLDTTSPPSEAYITANLSNSKYYSLSEVDSTFDISSIKDDISSVKDESLASAASKSEGTLTNADELISNLSPIQKNNDNLDSYKIDTQIEAANILSGGVAIFEDNENSYDGDELVIDDNVEIDEKSEAKPPESLQFKSDDHESSLISEDMDIGSKDTEVVLQIDGKNVDAIDIGNGLYLYRKAGQEELAAVQIIDDDQQQPSFKFLKVRENAEGNLEVYEEIEIEVPKEVPAKDGKLTDKITSHVPIKDINKVISESTGHELDIKTLKKEPTLIYTEAEIDDKETSPSSKSGVNLNGKMMKFSESRKSPVIGSFTPMTYHSTPNKEGIPLTKTMVDQQLHTNRHSEMSNAKKTIEVHTDSCKLKPSETSKNIDDNKRNEVGNIENETVESSNKNVIIVKEKESGIVNIKAKKNGDISLSDTQSKKSDNGNDIAETVAQSTGGQNKTMPLQLNTVTGSTCSNVTIDNTEVNIHIDDDNLITFNEVRSEDNVHVLDIGKHGNENVVHVKTTDPKKDNKIIQVEIVENIKHKEVEHIHHKETGNTKSNKGITGLSFHKVENTENSKAKKEEKVEKVDIEDSKCECMAGPMENDSSTKISNTENLLITQKRNPAEADNNPKVKKVQSTEISTICEPIIIDDDDVSVVEVIVEGDKQRSEKELQTFENSEPNTESITNTSEGNTVEALAVENKDLKLSEAAKRYPRVSRSEDQPGLSKGLISTNLLAEQVVIKGDALPSDELKDAEILSIQKSSPSQNEPVNKTEKPTDVNPLNPGSMINTPVNVCKTHLSQINDIKPNEKTTESSEIIESILNVEPTKHSVHINKSIIPECNQKCAEVTIVKQIIPTNSGKLSPSNLNVTTVNKSTLQKMNSNIFQESSEKETVKTLQLTEFRSIETNDSRQIGPVSKLDRLQNDLETDTKKNIQVNKLEKCQTTSDMKPPSTRQINDRNDIKISSKSTITDEKRKGAVCNKIQKPQSIKSCVSDKQDICSTSKIYTQTVKNKIELKEKKDIPKVPFGKWTDVNRQEFLNNIKIKVPITSSNSNQLKNSNDLNRRDVLKKIDSQRQSNNALSKAQEMNKLILKSETAAFSNKPNIISKEIFTEDKLPKKSETHEAKPKILPPKNTLKLEVKTKTEVPLATNITSLPRNEICQRTGVVQNLIDKTIEGMIHRSTPAVKVLNDTKQHISKEPNASIPVKLQQTYKPIEQTTLDEIEMKMNELHGIPFIERPPHELPQLSKLEDKTCSKTEQEKLPVSSKAKIPNLLPFPSKSQNIVQENVLEVDSEDEIIEHEPITGDTDIMNKKSHIKKSSLNEVGSVVNLPIQQTTNKLTAEIVKKEAIITEKDFDKFARRNSITYENRITVNFDAKEPLNVVQTVVEKASSPKSYGKKDHGRVDPKVKPYNFQNVRTNVQPIKLQPVTNFIPSHDDASNRNQSKLQKAYHSVMTAKRQLAADSPITIIEDRPVKVVFMESGDYVPSQLNVQGQDLSPAKKVVADADVTVSTCDSIDSDLMDHIDDQKSQDEIKAKTKHQRKQVLTPVEEPELELIKPSDLGIEVSPKKKRKTDEDNRDKNLKYPMRKKLYLLGSSAVTEEKSTHPVEIVKNPLKETANITDNSLTQKISALDSLVKAAELIETQTDNNMTNISPNLNSQSNTPVKRGRGRPRKYPLTPDGAVDKSIVTVISPKKKPRLIDAKVPKPKRDSSTEDSDSGTEIIKENWTMGKINENIVCPICNKLFRTENVVFKHVKHCTGPSPSRSDSDKRSPRRMRISQDFDNNSHKSDDMDDDQPLITAETPKKRTFKDSISDKKPEDIIVIEDTPMKELPHKMETRKHVESIKPESKIPQKNNLVCEFCGKTFRQLSYLISHKTQHKKVDKSKKAGKDTSTVAKSYVCEVCKKEFRKLHHLVQHRIIHNPSTVPAKTSRKTSSEQSESKIDKDLMPTKQGEDQSAGFRCEPCDKSFRKLHHLVEHRETHDGINRQKTSTSPTNKDVVEKSVALYHCGICKKAFKKLELLNEHKEEHVETSSEKTVTVNDIIHECSICYMVFPNEHSLNKHTIICQRKKRQSKQQKPADESGGVDEAVESPLPDNQDDNIDNQRVSMEHIIEADEKPIIVEKIELLEDTSTTEEPVEVTKEKSEDPIIEKSENISETVERNLSEIEQKEPVKIQETPKKKTTIKDKIVSTATKRLKSTNTSTNVTEHIQPAVESSDDDEVRYMLNPDFKVENIPEEKIFMKVKSRKRNSLQIERPNSKELVKRRTSLQHPPKIPRLKPKAVEPTVRKSTKPKLEPVPSTDSDDSEATKYSFPVTIPVKSIKPAQNRTPKNSERKVQKKSLVDKRKTLSAIAKRKSMGNSSTSKPKASPLKQAKKRTLTVEHRCDCGQLFSSAALLSRHTSLAHTPPRIRRNRSPPPKTKQPTAPRKLSSSSPSAVLKPEKSDSNLKPRRVTAHRGVPVPEKMRKFMLNNK